MADTKLSALTATTALDPADLLHVIVDVATTPANRKITWANVVADVAAETKTLTNTTIDANGTGNSLTNIEVADFAAAAKTGSDTAVVTGTAGTSGDLSIWNADGDLVDGPTPPTGTIVGTTDAQALTNKTIALGSNTVSGTTAEFNTALSDGSFATLAGSETLTNKTLTAATLQDGLTIDTESINWTGAVTLDPANGLLQEITLTGNVTGMTDSLADGEAVILMIDDGTAYTIVWPTITWTSDSAAAPTLQTAAKTVVQIWKAGTTLYGHAANGG